MKELSLERMENVRGGLRGKCGAAIWGFGLNVAGLIAGGITMNPFAIGFGAAALPGTFTGLITSCGSYSSS